MLVKQKSLTLLHPYTVLMWVAESAYWTAKPQALSQKTPAPEKVLKPFTQLPTLKGSEDSAAKVGHLQCGKITLFACLNSVLANEV